MKKRNTKKILKGALILIIGVFLGLLISPWKQKNFINYYREHNESDYVKFDTIKQLLQSEYLEPEKLIENKNKMLEKAIAGFVNGLEDPYTTYLTSEENKELENMETIECPS